MPVGTSLSGRQGLSDVSIGADFSRHQSDREVGSFGVFVSLDGIIYTPLSAPLDNPIPPTFFNIDTTVRARDIAYYFDNCAGPDCPGSRVFEVYAIGTTKEGN